MTVDQKWMYFSIRESSLNHQKQHPKHRLENAKYAKKMAKKIEFSAFQKLSDRQKPSRNIETCRKFENFTDIIGD